MWNSKLAKIQKKKKNMYKYFKQNETQKKILREMYFGCDLKNEWKNDVTRLKSISFDFVRIR